VSKFLTDAACSDWYRFVGFLSFIIRIAGQSFKWDNYTSVCSSSCKDALSGFRDNTNIVLISVPKFSVNKQKIAYLVNTGSSVFFFPSKFVSDTRIQSTPINLHAADGRDVRVHGKTLIEISIREL